MWLTAIKKEDKCELNESLTRVDDIKAQSFIFYLWLPQQHHKTAKVVWQKEISNVARDSRNSNWNDFYFIGVFCGRSGMMWDKNLRNILAPLPMHRED